MGKRVFMYVDSVCGSGKTLGAEVASVILSKNWEEVGTLIVVRLTEQCLDVANRINELSQELCGRLIARPMFSRHTSVTGEVLSGKLTPEEVQDTQVIVITHENYLRTISGRKKDMFSRWRKGKRKFRVVDEALDLVERFDLTREEMANLRRMIELRRNPIQVYEEWGNHMDMLDEINRFMRYKIESGQLHKIDTAIIDNHRVDGNEIYFSELIDFFQNSTPKDWEVRKWKEGAFDESMESCALSLVKLDRLIRRSLYCSGKEGSTTYSTGEVILPSAFECLCVLDATSNVDKIYKLFKQQEQITQYQVDRDVRNFRNCSLKIRPESAGLGLGVTKNQVQPRAKKVVKWSNDHFLPTDKVLFAGHKVFMQHLQSILTDSDVDFEWDVCWWNAIDGRNTLKDFNKLVVLSINYLPPHYDAVTKIGFQSDVNSEVDPTEDSAVAESSIAVKIIQLLARIKTRTVMNEHGDCPDTEVFLLLPGDEFHPDEEDEIEFEPLLSKFSQYILKEIRKSMHQVSVHKWLSFSGFAPPRTDSSGDGLQERFLKWTKQLKPGESANKKDLKSLSQRGTRQTFRY